MGLNDRLAVAQNELAYHVRNWWIRAKDAAGLPRTKIDRSFYITQLARKIKSGDIPPSVRIAAMGKTDGAGAQALAKISAMTFAAAVGREYIHVPFRKIQHAEGPQDEWTKSWEDVFKLGRGYRNFDDIGIPPAPLGDFLKDRSKWPEECVVHVFHYQNWTRQNTWAFAPIIPKLRENYYLGTQPTQNQNLVVAVHVRRGDVSETKYRKSHFTPNLPIVTALRQALSVIKARGIEPTVQIFSQGAPEDFRDFSEFNAEFHLNTPAIWTFRQLVEADVLIMARSAFSYVAALLSDGIKIYDPFLEDPLPDWIVRDARGRFDGNEFSRRLSLASNANARVSTGPELSTLVSPI